MFGRRGVAVIDASSLRHMRFRAVHLLGVAERSWPPPPRPDPLLLEGERRRINEEAEGAALPLRTEPDEHELEFWLAVQSPLEQLAISYSRAEAGRSGKHLPSYFFRSIVDAIEGRRLSLEELEWSPHVRRIEAGRLTCDPIDDALSLAEYDRGLVRLANEGAAPAAIAALSRDAARPGFGRAVIARRQRWGLRQLTAYDGVMTDAASVRAAAEASVFLDPAKSVSASRLETYATCPYRYFLKYALYINPLDEPEQIDRIDPLQRGTLIHEILQTFFERTGRADPPRAERRTAHLARLDEISRDCGEERERRGVTGRPLIWKMDKQAIDEDLVRWYDQEVEAAAGSDLLPGAFEARFGPAYYGAEAEDEQLSTDEPLELTVDGRVLRVQGRIDRIDWDEARTTFRVIDYKTGTKRAKANLNQGKALQLPIYLHAAAKMLGMPPERGESQYFYVSSKGGFGRVGLSGETIVGRASELEQVLGTIADGVDAGTFPANPIKDHCKFCDYKDICDVRITKIAERKIGDPRGAAFIALREIE